MTFANGYEEVKVLETVTALVKPVLAEHDLELFDVQFQREQSGWVLRLIIDREAEGVTLDDCATISREVGYLLEVEDLVDCSYRLEVSSPGLDRPLRGEADFVRFTGRRAKVTTREPIGGQQSFVGVLEQVKDNELFLAGEKGVVHIPLAGITKARLEVEF